MIRLRMLRRSNLVTFGLLLASVCFLGVSVIMNVNIKVLANWNLTLPMGDIHVGDTIVVASTYNKLRQVTGTSTRTIECQSTPGIYISTPLNEVPANRAPSGKKKTGTGIVVTIPNKLSGITKLPDPCHVCVALTYPVLPFRNVDYFKCTKDFKLLPLATPVAVSSAATQTSPVQVSLPSHTSSQTADGSISSSNSSSDTTPSQSNLPQPENPSLIHRAFSGIRHIIDSVL